MRMTDQPGLQNDCQYNNRASDPCKHKRYQSAARQEARIFEQPQRQQPRPSVFGEAFLKLSSLLFGLIFQPSFSCFDFRQLKSLHIHSREQ